MLLAVPNVSEGRDARVIEAIAGAFSDGGGRLLDRHADPDHHRTVFTVAAEPGRLAASVLGGARAAVERIDLARHRGVHPRVGAVDVAPVVFLDEADRGVAAAEALVLADLLGEELEVPIYLYGDLAGGRTRAALRRPGALEGLEPDFGPRRPHPTAGVTLVAARRPLVAFNVEVAADLTTARRIAARVRDELPAVRALGLELPAQGLVQVSTNIEDHRAASPADVVAAVARDAAVTGAELVGLAPAAAFAGFPATVPLRGLRTIEEALRES